MSPTSLLRTAGWLVCGLYATIPAFWMAVHPFVHRWRRARFKFKLLAPWWMLLWVMAWIVSWPWRNAILYDRPALWIVSFACWAVSITMYSHGGSGLSIDRIIGKHEVEPNATQHLVTTGIYAHVRNPIYFGHICTMLGWSLGTGTIACWSLTAFYVTTLLIMIPQEERELEQRFGAEYRDYTQRVPRLIPKFGK